MSSSGDTLWRRRLLSLRSLLPCGPVQPTGPVGPLKRLAVRKTPPPPARERRKPPAITTEAKAQRPDSDEGSFDQ